MMSWWHYIIATGQPEVTSQCVSFFTVHYFISTFNLFTQASKLKLFWTNQCKNGWISSNSAHFMSKSYMKGEIEKGLLQQIGKFSKENTGIFWRWTPPSPASHLIIVGDISLSHGQRDRSIFCNEDTYLTDRQIVSMSSGYNCKYRSTLSSLKSLCLRTHC